MPRTRQAQDEAAACHISNWRMMVIIMLAITTASISFVYFLIEMGGKEMLTPTGETLAPSLSGVTLCLFTILSNLHILPMLVLLAPMEPIRYQI